MLEDSDTEPEDDRNLEEEGHAIAANLLPEKSRKRYECAHREFSRWFEQNKGKEITENVLLVYFKEASKRLKVSTMWAIFSMLKSTLNLKNGTDIDKFTKVKTFLRLEGKGQKVKQSKIFTIEHIKQFLSLTDDYLYLVRKVFSN